MARASNSGIEAIPAAEVAEIMAEASTAAGPKIDELEGGTVRSTETVYEDRTVNPVIEPELIYPVAESHRLEDGTLVETYGEGVKEESN